LDASTLQRIASFCDRSSLDGFSSYLLRDTGAAASYPAFLVECIDDCTPDLRIKAGPLLRSMASGPWKVVLVTGGEHYGVNIQCNSGKWRVHIARAPRLRMVRIRQLLDNDGNEVLSPPQPGNFVPPSMPR